MERELLRVESAVSATASGNLTDGRWQHDVSTALAMSGIRNKLGFVVVRFLSNTRPTSVDVWEIVLMLASLLIKAHGMVGTRANEIAWQGFSWWRDSRCVTCGGRGHDVHHRQCPDCRGTGRRKMPQNPPELRDVISSLMEAERWMEGQLNARLKGARYAQQDDGYKVHLPEFGIRYKRRFDGD